MRFHIFRGEDLFAGQIFQPPGTAPLGSCLGPPHEVALAHDSKELVLLVDAGHGADAVGEKATSSTRAFGRTLMTAETITSAAFMSHTFSGDIGGTLALRRGLRTASQGDEHLERQGVFTIVAPIVATLPSLTGRCPGQIRRTIFPALTQRATPAQVTKQSGIRQS